MGLAFAQGSPVRAHGRGADAGDAAVQQRPCTIAIRGEIQHTTACTAVSSRVPSQSRFLAEAGLPAVFVFEAPLATDAGIEGRVAFVSLRAPPRLGNQAATETWIEVEVSWCTSKWEASSYHGRPTQLGSIRVNLTDVRSTKAADGAHYELHGTVDAELLPSVEGTATGVVTLHADF